MIFGVTNLVVLVNTNCKLRCSIVNTKCNVNPPLFVIPCNFWDDYIDHRENYNPEITIHNSAL